MPDITFFSFTIPMDTNLATMLALVFLAGIIRGFCGFGSALLVVPAFTAYVTPASAVVIGSMIELPVTAFLLPSALKHADRRAVLPMLATFALCVPIGAFALKVINPEPMKIVIALFVLGAVAILFKQKQLARMLTPSAILFTGALAGITQGLTAIAGPLFATALLARGDTAGQTRANIVAVAAGVIVLTVATYAVFGQITRETLVYSTIATPAILLGVWLGAHLFSRFSDVNLRPIILIFLAISALYLLVRTVL